MTTYRKAEADDVALLREVMRAYHPRLIEAGVEIGLLYANAATDPVTGEAKGPALRLHGQACYATVKINSLADRVEGKPDATVRIDADSWPEHAGSKKVAILDHELAHLLVVTQPDGGKAPGGRVVKLDDCERPVLKMRQHDLVVGGFSDVVARHRLEAVESDH